MPAPNVPQYYLPSHLKNRPNSCGFNLVEAAIVLGVVGLVIGGIWVAAATVTNKLFTKDMVAFATSALEIIHQNSRALTANTSNDLSLHNFLAASPLPGNPHNYSALCLGVPGLCASFSHSPAGMPAGHIHGGFSFVKDPDNYSNWTTNPTLCLELSKLLLQQNYVDPYITWGQIEPSYHFLGNWSGGAPPSVTQLLTYCASAQELAFSGMSP